jgi:hypothetical protein
VDGVTVAVAGVRATARILARDDGRGGTSLPVLEGDGPLALRRTRGSGTEARVMLVGAMSGPLGGDHFTVEAGVETGARLRVGSAAATIALPGQTKDEARYDVRLTVSDGGELHWLPARRPGSFCARSRCSGVRGRSPGGSGVVWSYALLGGPYWTRSWRAGPEFRAAGTGPRCSRGIGPSVKSSSYGRTSRRSR